MIRTPPRTNRTDTPFPDHTLCRSEEWRIAARALADHPIAGVGPEGYRIAFADAVDADYQRAHGRDQQPDRAHAAPLDVALAGGLPALAAWFAVMAQIGRAHG